MATQNQAIVISLYKALAMEGQCKAISSVLASDLEWRFHGPPRRNYMMRILTGASLPGEFCFNPKNVASIDDVVIVEGWEGAQAYWVHVWNVKDGMIVHFKEYFNTWLIVKELKPAGWMVQRKESSSTLWQSALRGVHKRSLPGLLLAI
ncbi:unnamed protein product [Rhodiola kirilowii]